MILQKSILELSPSAEFVITNNDLDTIEWKDGDFYIPSKTEIMEKVKEITNRENTEKNKKEELKKSAIDKLIDLGLTDEEAKAFLG